MAEIMQQIVEAIEEMNRQVDSIHSNISDIIDIANLSSNTKEVAELLVAECSDMKYKLTKYDFSKKKISHLLNKIEFEPKEAEKEVTVQTPLKTEGKKIMNESISLRPHTAGQRLFHPDINSDKLLPVVEMQISKMAALHALPNTDYRYVDFSGIYPRINYLQASPPEEIRYWFDFGAINSIYMNPPEFHEISLLPHWIYNGVKDCYLNNPTIGPKDILVLKFMSAGPDFHEEERYDAYHFIQLGKAEAFSIGSSRQNEKKPRSFAEHDIHYRRGLGLNVILKGLEATGKKGFRTYGGKKIYSSIMISPAKYTPPAAEKYLNNKIQLIEKGLIKSSPQAQAKLCQLRRHDKGTCPACSKMKAKEESILINSSSEDD